VSGVIALALASSVGAMFLTGPRVTAAMGHDHRALGFLARRTSRGAPAVAVAFQAALALLLVGTSSFGALLAYIGFTLSVCAGLTVLGVLVLRWREPRIVRPYRAWGYPVTPLLFVALSVWMVAQALVERPASSIAGVATIAAAALLHALVARTGEPAR
jgi:APA family basic amino acid/polyamine antiporter